MNKAAKAVLLPLCAICPNQIVRLWRILPLGLRLAGSQTFRHEKKRLSIVTAKFPQDRHHAPLTLVCFKEFFRGNP